MVYVYIYIHTAVQGAWIIANSCHVDEDNTSTTSYDSSVLSNSSTEYTVRTVDHVISWFCVCTYVFLRLQTEFFLFQVSFCPVKRGNRAGSSRNEFTLGEVPRPVSGVSIVAVAIISDYFILRSSSFFNFLPRKKVDQTEPPFWSTVSFQTTQLKNERVRNFRNCDSREAENWSGYLSESSQTYSEKSRLDFLALSGKN